MDSHLGRALESIDRATREMTIGQLGVRPPGKWCAAEILEHLARSFSGTVRLMQKCLDAGHPSATRPTWRHRLATTVVVGLRHMPNGRESPEAVRPKGMPVEQVVRTIRENLVTMDGVLAQCEARFGTRVKVADHPILGALTVKQWRTFHLVHTCHHMKQIERLSKIASA